MNYRQFGSTGERISALGFGCMRFPEYEKDGKKNVDTDKVDEMLAKAYERGVNYFDTAPYYCNGGSEAALGHGVKPFRDKILLSTKFPTEVAKKPGDYRRQLESSLERLGTDHIDFYHFWGISLDKWEKKLDTPDGPLARALKLRDQGVIRHISFSFHDKPENMMEIIRRGQGQLASVLCQYNLLDRANEDAIAFAHEQGLGVTIMGPVGGGRLGAPSQVIQDLLPGKVQSSAEMALRFVMNNPNVNIALSGMSSMEMVEENARVASDMSPLSAEENARVDAMLEENRRLAELYCTGCNYCMPCPKGLNIPEIFKMMNYHRVYGLTDYAKKTYAAIGSGNLKFQNAAACVGCGQCEKKCPQHLHIREQLRVTHDTLSK